MRKLLAIPVLLLWVVPCLLTAQETPQYNLPIRSDLDTRDYRGFVLENGLKVLLVSDPKTDRAGASMDVNVGSGSDPAEWNGLAHFLEHMLFLGTEKYPNPAEYAAFIKDHGGSHNAYTSYEHTNYFFTINHDSLEPALDRLSRFFIDPILDAEHVDSERAIVHSEYQALRKEEGRRIWETQKTILNPGHPASRFTVGSQETLRDREGISARERLIAFYEQWYSAEIMALAVVGRESLDVLETWVREKFSQIPGRAVVEPAYIQSYLNRDLPPVRLDIVPKKEIYQVSFQWGIPSVYEDYLNKPMAYVSNLLGHEGKGSLLAALKQRGWAESLSAGAGFMDRQQGTLMVSIGLTEIGLDHLVEIGEMLFQTIAQIREEGIENWRFEEQQRLGEIAFQFAEPRTGGALARSLSASMQRYPFEDVLRGPYVMQTFEPDAIRILLEDLRPETVYMQVVSPTHKVRQVTEWYDVNYGISPIHEQWIERWQAADTMSDPALHLPMPNPFIPERLELVSLSGSNSQPIELTEVDSISAWYRGDQEFRAPKASFFVNLKSPVANESARHTIKTELLVRLLTDRLNAFSYPAQLAEVSYSLYHHSRGLSIRLNGFQDKQPKLLETLLDAIQNATFDKERLALVRDDLMRELNNRKLNRPVDQTIHEIYRLVMSPYWTDNERLAAMADISVEDIQRHAQSILDSASLVTLAHGDLTKVQAIHLNQQLRAILPDIASENVTPRPQIRRLGNSSPYLRTMDVDHGDTALSYYFQGGEKSYHTRASSQLLGKMIESRFYHQFRVENQVGYLVFATAMDLMEVPGTLLAVQSSTHTAQEIDALVQGFLVDFSEELAAMDEEEFRRVQSSLVAKIVRRDTNLSDRSDRYWREIDLEKYAFDSRERLAKAVGSLSQADLVDYVRSLFTLTPRVIKIQSSGRRAGASQGALGLEGSIQTGTPELFRQVVHDYFPSR